MAKLTDEMKALFGRQLGYIATVDENGVPNLGPKRSLRVYDDETLMFNENTGKQTMKNIQTSGKAAVAISNWSKLEGFRFVGKAEIHTEGDYYEAAKEWAADGNKMGVPKAAGVIHIEKIYTLKSGPTAGDLLEG